MNKYYVKAILYAYPNLEFVAEQIDEILQEKALLSMEDFRPCLEQCEDILEYTYQKDCLFALKIILDEVITRLSPSEVDYLEYKYFKRKPKGYFENFDAESRGYFRKQMLLAEKVGVLLEHEGMTDKEFEEKYLTIEFFKRLLKCTIEHENACYKNKSKKVKTFTQKVKIKKLSA